MAEIFTIGYAGLDLARFVDILKSNAVKYLIDVRSVPKSQYFTPFNDTNLKIELPKHGIEYLHFKNEFGARQDDPAFYTNGVVDFDKFAVSPQFQSGIDKVAKLCENGAVCLMCAEIDPINCHRAILVARHLPAVTHIIAKRNGETKTETQTELETRLCEMFKTDPATAYQKQNQKIGFKS